MKRIQMPSSYAVVTEEEKELLGGGGAFRDAWDSFTDHLRLNDFFFRGGLLSLSISFIPMLLFNVVKAGFHVAENVHTFLFGGPSKAATDIENYRNDMHALREDMDALQRWVSTMPQGIFFVFTGPASPPAPADKADSSSPGRRWISLRHSSAPPVHPAQRPVSSRQSRRPASAMRPRSLRGCSG